MGKSVRLYFLLVRRVPPVESPILAEVFAILTRSGFAVETGIAEELVQRPDLLPVAHDLYVMKSHTELSLSVAGVLDAQDARLLNPFAGCAAAQNKIVASRRLRAAGIPTPRMWVTGDPRMLESVATRTALLIKPYLGHRGAGIRVVRGPDDLLTIPPGGPIVAQEYVDAAEEDLKVYVVGDEVFAVRKPFSPDSFALPGRPCSVDAELREIALRCGRAFGLGLYGLDVVEGRTGRAVVDLNTFPGYKGVPDVAPRIAAYIERYAFGLEKLELPTIPVAGEPIERVAAPPADAMTSRG